MEELYYLKNFNDTNLGSLLIKYIINSTIVYKNGELTQKIMERVVLRYYSLRNYNI